MAKQPGFLTPEGDKDTRQSVLNALWWVSVVGSWLYIIAKHTRACAAELQKLPELTGRPSESPETEKEAA